MSDFEDRLAHMFTNTGREEPEWPNDLPETPEKADEYRDKVLAWAYWARGEMPRRKDEAEGIVARAGMQLRKAQVEVDTLNGEVITRDKIIEGLKAEAAVRADKSVVTYDVNQSLVVTGEDFTVKVREVIVDQGGIWYNCRWIYNGRVQDATFHHNDVEPKGDDDDILPHPCEPKS